MSATDPSAPGLPLAGGSGGGGLPTAAGADEVPASTGAGTAYTARTVAALLAVAPAANALAINPYAAISLASATGWVDVSTDGTITASVNTGAQQLDLVYPVAASNGLNAAIAHAAYWTLGAVEIRARLRAIAGPAHQDHRAGIYLSGAWPGAANYCAVEIALDGTARVRSATADGAWVTVASLLAGQGWVRFVREGGMVRGYVGTGSAGVAPTAWTFVGSITTSGAVPDTSVGYVTGLLGSAGARLSEVSASWGDLSWRESA